MENHPIPQDITGFQFKLIGEMTVKQFGYIAAGGILAWIFIFVLPLPVYIRFPIGLLFAGLGLSLAFLPIEGRPMDTMLGAFMLTLIRPNQYVFRKHESLLTPIFAQNIPQPYVKTVSQKTHSTKYTEEQVETFIQNYPKKAKNKWDEKELAYNKTLAELYVPLPAIDQNQPPIQETVKTIPIPVPQQTAQGIPQSQMLVHNTLSTTQVSVQQPSEKSKAQENINAVLENTQSSTENSIKKTDNDKLEKEKIKRELEVARLEEANQQNESLAKNAHEKVNELEKLLNDSSTQKQKLEQELLQLKKQLEGKNPDVFTPSQGPEKLQETKNVQVVQKSMTKATGLPQAPEAPNLLTGIVRDPRNNPLPNILIEVKDKDGNPVRAFKTNMLGYFASATPLQNGIFTVEFEDTQNVHKFDVIQLETKGQVIMPLAVTSVDAREELRRSLFTSPQEGAN